MPTKSLIIEIGCEEIPSRFVTSLSHSFRESLEKELVRHGIQFEKGSSQIYSTYRRLVVFIKDVSEDQDDQVISLTGPPLAISKDDNGDWTVPAKKFAEKCGCSLEELHVSKDVKNRDILFFERKKKGGRSLEVLSSILPDVITSLHLPIAMKWGVGEHTFIRPVHWVLALFGDEVVPFDLFSCQSGSRSLGHRILSNNVAIKVNHADTYVDQLREAFVLVSPREREQVITTELQRESSHWDAGLLDEVKNLVEWPTPLIGEIEDKYLTLPSSVIAETMKTHQKFFPLYDGEDLKRTYLVIADNVTDKNRSTVLNGNGRVLKARLEDALFFWTEDLKRPLDSFVEKLKTIVYQQGIGTIHDKVTRIETLSVYLNEVLSLSIPTESLKLSSRYSKSDLASQMVYEFPDLQGEMAKYYAQHHGFSPDISLALHEHYFPLQAGGKCPTQILSAIVGLADRLDHIVGSYVAGHLPTGSKDPLGIRRAMYTLMELCDNFELNLDITRAIDKAYELYGGEKNRSSLIEFFTQRLKSYFEDKGLNHDEALSIIELSYRDLRHRRHLEPLFESRKEQSFKLLVDNAVRVKRLARKLEHAPEVNESLFKESIENKLWTHFQESNTDILSLNEILPEYFEHVLVMDPDSAVKHNRLSVLKAIDDWYSLTADFEKISI